MPRKNKPLPHGFNWREIAPARHGEPTAIALDFSGNCLAIVSPMGTEWKVSILADVGPSSIRTQTVAKRAQGQALLTEWARGYQHTLATESSANRGNAGQALADLAFGTLLRIAVPNAPIPFPATGQRATAAVPEGRIAPGNSPGLA
ncbi:hypothetical protein [Pseudoxanthomonas wuyuanensis]